jgi:hypothetical protein
MLFIILELNKNDGKHALAVLNISRLLLFLLFNVKVLTEMNQLIKHVTLI